MADQFKFKIGGCYKFSNGKGSANVKVLAIVDTVSKGIVYLLESGYNKTSTLGLEISDPNFWNEILEDDFNAIIAKEKKEYLASKKK